jgi:hypothetical protein
MNDQYIGVEAVLMPLSDSQVTTQEKKNVFCLF